MPSNGLEDRVHNFFAQDNSLQGQHHSQAAEGNWPVPNSNFWVGGHRQDTDRGTGSYPHHVTQDLSFSQSHLRPDFAKSQPLKEQLNLNGFMYEKQFSQARQNEANFLAVDRNPNQRHFITSKGLSVHDFQQIGVPDHLSRTSARQEMPESPVNFDLFGGPQQRSHQQSSMLPRQHSEMSNMQQLQQQLMIRKMQELHRQQQLQNLDLRQNNSNNEVTHFAKPTFSNQQSSSIYGTPNSESLQYPWAAERGINWTNRGSPTFQGSPGGQGFPPNLGQIQQLVDLVPQQVDQSLYGVPVSNSKGLPVNQYPRMVTARSSMPQMPISSNHLQGQELNLLADQVDIQNEPSIHKHEFQKENMFGFASGTNAGMRNMGGLQQVNSLSRSSLQQDFVGRQEAAVPPETSHEKLNLQVASPQNQVALDPTEEKILFSSDVNIWDAFGNLPHMSREAGDAFEDCGLSNDLPSIQSGSWSALMQSAVAETSSSDVVPPEEWDAVVLNKNNGLSRGQTPSTHIGSSIQQASSADENIRIASALNSELFPRANDIDTANAMGLNRFGEKFQSEPNRSLQAEMSERFVQSQEETGKRPNIGPFALRNQICDESSSHSLLVKTSSQTHSPTWMPGHNGTGLRSSGWNPQAAIPPRGDRVAFTHEAEKLQQNSRNNEVKMMQGDMVHRSSFWNSNPIPSSAVGLDHVNSRVGDHQERQGSLSSKDASVAKSCNGQTSDETSSIFQNSYLHNQWKNAHPPARSQDGGSLGRPLFQANDLNHVSESTNSHEKGEVPRIEMENCDGKENSNDSHRSNLSQHTSGGFRESGLSDVSDSQTYVKGKHTSANQVSRKVSAPRKFQYHPMNLDDDADANPSSGLKHSTPAQAMSQQNAYFGLPKIFGQIPRNSTVTDKGQSSELHRDPRDMAKEPSHGNLSVQTPTAPMPFSRTADAHIPNNASLSSQNMLELLHKVDQSRNHGAKMQFKSSEYKSSSRQPETEYSDGFGRLQHSQSPVSQGFGLQLGPPSQKRVLDHSLSSQIDQETFSSSTAAVAAGMVDKGQQMVPSHSVQSLPSAEEAQVNFGLSRSTTGYGNDNSSRYKTRESFISAFHSGTPHSRGNVQSQQIARVSGKMPMSQHLDSFNRNASHPAQRLSSETLLPDTSSSFQQDNLTSSGGMHRQSRPDDEQERVQTDSALSSDHEGNSRQSAMPEASLQGNPGQCNMWSNVPKLQHNIQFQQVPSHIPEAPLPNIVESSSGSLMQGYVNLQGVANGEEQRLKEISGQPLASINTETITKMTKSLGRAPCMKRLSDGSPSSSAEQRDTETFGRSLKPNSISHQNSLSQSQLEVLKDRETDSGDRASKRMRGPDSIESVQHGALRAGQHNEHNDVVGGSIGSSSGLQTEDSKSLGFSGPLDVLQRKVPHQGHVALNDSLGLNKDVSQSFACNDQTSVRTDQLQASPQIGSSWFGQYGTSSNGKMMQIYSANQVTPMKPGETPFVKASSNLDTVNPEVRGTALPSDAWIMNSSHQSEVVLRHKKRTKASPGLLPWHKEMSQDSQDLWSLSMAEIDWNEASSRLTEKVEDDAELIEDGPPVLRSKRRLILTTQLMQQLLRPAPADVFWSDASHSYDILAYCVSRIALGDACSMASRLSNLEIPCDNTDLLRVKGNSLKRLSHGKAIEEVMERARKLEYVLLRLDRNASISDLRVECQELEKFAILNRFAKFHGRGQHDNAETGGTENIQKPIPQRYVTAHPMPTNLQDRVQCLSL